MERLGSHRWSDIASDPNDPSALAWRRERLMSAHRTPVRDRVQYLLSLVRGRSVLDVGPVAHVVERQAREDWLHKQISDAASHCLGVDVLESEVEELQAAGYNIRVCDVLDRSQRRNLDGGYEVMLCGELIEHLDNPGALMEAAADLLAPDGRLVLTTPNPFYLWGWGRHALHRPNDSVDHVMFLFPSGIAELAERHGLVLAVYRGSMIPGLTWKHYAAFRFGIAVQGLVNPDVFCTRMIYEVVHSSPPADPAPGPADPRRIAS